MDHRNENRSGGSVETDRSNLFYIGYALLALFVLAMIVFGVTRLGNDSDETLRVGCVLLGSIDDGGWNEGLYEGMLSACETHGAALVIRENIREDDVRMVRGAIQELAEAGCGMIVLTSNGYMNEEVGEMTNRYPNIAFYGFATENGNVGGMTTYFGRYYQARYLAGIVAGMRTETNRIGYVAAMSNTQVRRGINAFALGAQSVNPDAQVIVRMTEAWDDEDRAQDAAERLIEGGCDVLTYHQDTNRVLLTAEAAGVDCIAYHTAYEGMSIHYLTSVMCDWGKVFDTILRDFLKGEANSTKNYWLGVAEEAVDLSTCSVLVNSQIRRELTTAKERLATPEDVFSGEIYDTEGNLRCEEGEKLSDEVLLKSMDWYVRGVVFDED